MPLIPQIAGNLIASGRKTVKTAFNGGVSGGNLCGYEENRHIYLAACVEFIHTATLLHDDVVDESTLRRGTISANAKWNNKASVLVGDFLFSRAFELMVADGFVGSPQDFVSGLFHLLLKEKSCSFL